MNRRQQINKILHDHIEVDKNTDYTNYKKLITAIEEWHEQQVKSVDLADVGGTLLSDVVTKTDDGNYMILLIDGNKNYATYADNLPELFDRLADAFRAMEDTEL